jgi:hypothetical protein
MQTLPKLASRAVASADGAQTVQVEDPIGTSPKQASSVLSLISFGSWEKGL